MTTATTDKVLPRCEQCHAELLPDIGHPDYQKHDCQPPETATPRPWRAVNIGGSFSIDSVAADYAGIAFVNPMGIHEAIGSPLDKANAALIVRAVNAHDKLIEALCDIKRHVESAYDEDAESDPTWKMATEALKLARGE